MGRRERIASLALLGVLAGCGGGKFQQEPLESQPPLTIIFDQPSPGAQIIGDSVTVGVHATSASSVQSLRLLIDGSFLALANGPVLQGAFQVPAGKHWLEAIAIDGKNNRGFAWRQFSAANKLQLVTNLPADGSVLPSPLVISASVPQPNAGTEISVSVDGKQVFAGGAAIAASVPMTIGQHELRISAVDSTGQDTETLSHISTKGSILFIGSTYAPVNPPDDIYDVFDQVDTYAFDEAAIKLVLLREDVVSNTSFEALSTPGNLFESGHALRDGAWWNYVVSVNPLTGVQTVLASDGPTAPQPISFTACKGTYLYEVSGNEIRYLPMGSVPRSSSATIYPLSYAAVSSAYVESKNTLFLMGVDGQLESLSINCTDGSISSKWRGIHQQPPFANGGFV